MDLNENFEIIKPALPELSGKIAYYYFHTTNSPKYSRSFYYYPNYRIALNIFKGSKISWDAYSRTTAPSKNKEINSILTFTHKHRRKVIMNGVINKIGIIFEPLGLNHFVREDISKIIKETITPFDHYGNDLSLLGRKVFTSNKIEERRTLLDQFFISQYSPLSESTIQKAVVLVLKEKGSIQVSELADQLFMSRKTLYRLFKKHLTIHPKAFIKLVKFRNALDLYKKNRKKISLSSLAHLGKYYDQASFVKEIQNSTGTNPRKFFFELEDLVNSETTWKLEQN